ncbi:methyltransferase domain-containing protein [Candidatus Woesearchaeota archaeon]|nr:methyltransferase domain-containing protein [Candidatus Woesearchaeota archaeon]
MAVQQKEINDAYRLYGDISWFYNFLNGMPRLRKKSVRKIGLAPGDTVLDIGCGTGLNFPHIMEKIGASGKIVGIDCCKEMLFNAKKLALKKKWKNVKLVLGDATLAGFPKGTFDGAIATISLSAIPDHLKALAHAVHSLKRGKNIVITDGKKFSFKPFNLFLPLLRWNKSWDKEKDIIKDVLREYPTKAVEIKESFLGSQFCMVLTK